MFRQRKPSGERGAIVIHVAIALIALLAFSAFIIDQGLMYVSRRQAQNSADAGALAGALAMLFDGGSVGNPTPVVVAAQAYAANNVVWGEAPSAANVDVTLSGGGTSIPPCGNAPGCVRVDVMRNMPARDGTIKGSPLPVYFSHLVGMTNQGVRATATAQAGSGNSIRCLLPFAVIDRWADNFDENVNTTYFPNDGLSGIDGWTQNDMFQPPSLGHDDVYVAPYGDNPAHTGWKVTTDYGRQLILKDGSVGQYSSGWAMEVDLPNSTGSQDYRWNIQNCNEQPVGIATEANTCPNVDEPNGCLSVKTGVSQGPTSQGIGSLAQGLVGQDPTAYWDTTAAGPPGPGSGAVVGGGGMASPRLRPIAIIDINNYINRGCSGTTCVGKVANIIGFFVEGMCNDVMAQNRLASYNSCDDPNRDVVGRIVTLPGTFASGIGTVDPSAAFIEVVRLVR